MGTTARDQFLDLIGDIYDASLDARLWAGLSGRIARTFGSTSTVVKLHGAEGAVHLLEATPNLTVGDAGWASHWHSRDLWVQRSIAYGLSRVVTSDDLVAPEERGRSDFYQEWLHALDIHHMIGVVFAAEAGAVGVLGIHRPQDGNAFGPTDRQMVATMLPHLTRAMRISQRLAQAALSAATALESLDAIDAGVIVADGRGKVRHISRIAEAMLGQTRELEVRNGYLRAPAPAQQARLLATLDSTVGLAAGNTAVTPRALLMERDGRPAWSLAATPLRPRWDGLAWTEPLALLLLRDPEYPPIRIEQLRALYGLTRMEALTAAELGCGRPLGEIARTLGIGLGTVRSHLKQILIKTDTNRQAEAVAVIARSVATLPQAGSLPHSGEDSARGHRQSNGERTEKAGL